LPEKTQSQPAFLNRFGQLISSQLVAPRRQTVFDRKDRKEKPQRPRRKIVLVFLRVLCVVFAIFAVKSFGPYHRLKPRFI
jgi:hypothetical protein